MIKNLEFFKKSKIKKTFTRAPRRKEGGPK